MRYRINYLIGGASTTKDINTNNISTAEETQINSLSMSMHKKGGDLFETKIKENEFHKITISIENQINGNDIDGAYDSYMSNNVHIERCETMFEKLGANIHSDTYKCKTNKGLSYGDRASVGLKLLELLPKEDERIDPLITQIQKWKDKYNEKL